MLTKVPVRATLVGWQADRRVSLASIAISSSPLGLNPGGHMPDRESCPSFGRTLPLTSESGSILLWRMPVIADRSRRSPFSAAPTARAQPCPARFLAGLVADASTLRSWQRR